MKADNQTMDREIPVKEQRIRKMRKILMAVAIVAVGMNHPAIAKANGRAKGIDYFWHDQYAHH